MSQERLPNYIPEHRDSKVKAEGTPSPWGAAYRRTLTDIPFTQEIYHIHKSLAPSDHHEAAADFTNPDFRKLVLMSEARYKMVDAALRKYKADQILEIAAGLSPRGLIFTGLDSVIKYAEVDLSEKAAEKRQVLEMLYASTEISRRSNLEVYDGNILDAESLSLAVQNFAQKPIAVVNEGLLRYLDFNERTAAAKNIHTLLERYGGAWITPDINLQTSATAGPGPGYSESLVDKISKNRFGSEEEARQFFENLGFTVERHNFRETPGNFSAAKQMGMSEDEARNAVSKGVLFVMEVKT